MRDTDKTKEQLIAELAQMRQRITELEALEFKHKQVEEALRESEERLSGFMNSATDGFILFDSNFNCLEINKAALKITGLTKEEIVGKSITDVVPNIKETGRYDKYTEVIKTGNPFFVDDLVPHPKFGDINLALSAFKVGGGLGITIVDITERKQVEEALRESEEKYRQLVENLHEGVWVIDKDAYTSFVNPRMAEMLGYTVDEMLGKHLFSFMDQYGVEITTRSLERRKQGISEQRDFEFLHKDGTHVHMLLSASPIIDEEGNYAGAIAGMQDITERRQMEEALQESEEKYREIINTSVDGVISIDSHMKILVWNQGAERIFGYTGKDMLGQNIMKIVPDRYRELMSEGFAQFVRTGSGPAIGEVLKLDGLTKEGKEVSIELSLASRKVGETYIATAVIRDITERKRTEEAMRIKDNAIASSINAIAIADLENNLTYVNSSFVQLWQYSNENEILGRSTPEFWRVKEQANGVIESLFKEGSWVGELVAKRKDGSLFDVQLSASMVTDEAGQPICMMASFVDITERKRMEETLRESEEQYRDLLENANDLIQSVTPDGHFLYVNKMWRETLGYSEEEIANLTLWDIIHPDFVPYCKEVFQKIMSGETLGNIEVVFVAKDGKLVAVEGNVNFRIEQGEPVATRGIFRDITKRKKVEETLRESEEQSH